MKIVLVSRIDGEGALHYTASLARYLESLGHSVTFEKGTAERLGRDGVIFEEITGDMVVVVGGDGSRPPHRLQNEETDSAPRYQLGRGGVPCRPGA